MWYIIDGKDLRPEDQLVSVKELEDRLSKFETEVEQDIDQKVSDLSTSFVTKEPGKGLSSNDYTSTEKEQVATIEDKVDKVQGKQLSTEDYTTQEKQKLAELENYDDTEIRSDITSLETNKVDKIEGKGLSTNDYTNEEKSKLASLENYDDTDILSDISSLDSRVSDNEDAISLLNGDKLTSGSVLNTVDTEIAKVVADAPASFDTLKEIADWIADHPEDTTVMNAQIQQNKSDISSLDTSKADKSTTYTKDEVNSLLPNELADLTDDSTHRLVTDTEKTAWNAKGTYSKPNGGIPKTDLDSSVQTSLGKADTALQEHQDISGKVDKVTGKGLSSNDFTDTYKNNVDSNTSARHSHSNKSVLDDISSIDVTNWNNKSNFSGNYNDLTNKPTIPTVPTNVSAFTNDAGYLTQHQDISGKLDTSKVKTTSSTTAGDVYDVRYINTMLGDIETLLGGI